MKCQPALGLSLSSSCVTLGRLLHLSGPSFSLLENEVGECRPQQGVRTR